MKECVLSPKQIFYLEEYFKIIDRLEAEGQIKLKFIDENCYEVIDEIRDIALDNQKEELSRKMEHFCKWCINDIKGLFIELYDDFVELKEQDPSYDFTFIEELYATMERYYVN